MTKAPGPRIAIVCDWLTNMGGAEKVVLALHNAFPDAPVYTSTYDPAAMPAFSGIDVRTTYLQRLPKAFRNLHKFMPMIRVRAFQKLDLSDFDIIISSSSAEAKQIRKSRPDQIHICYCHTPIRYYWSHYDEYKKDPGFGRLNWLVRIAMPFMVPPLKKADFIASQSVDYFIANSSETQDRIKRFYERPSEIIYPPIDTKRFNPSSRRGSSYVVIGRQVPYKRIDLAVQACTKLSLPLEVFGNGSEHEQLVRMAGPTVSFHTDRLTDASDTAVNEALNNAKGFIFPSEEDFGITPVEALAAGAPVIAFEKGGARDYMKVGETGVTFESQTVENVVDAIQKAEKIRFSPTLLQNRAKRFDSTLFDMKIKNFVRKVYRG